jgi:hypothetical protein
MTRPRLLDLFCGAVALHYRYGNRLRGMRRDRARTAVYQAVLLQSLLSPCRSRLSEVADLSTLRCRIPGGDTRRRQPAALLQAMREESQREDRPRLANRSSRVVQGLSSESTGEESGLQPQAVVDEPGTNHRAARWSLCGLRSIKSSLAPRRLHSDRTQQSISASAPLQVRLRAPGTLPHPLCESPLRIDPDGTDRRDRDHAIGGMT